MLLTMIRAQQQPTSLFASLVDVDHSIDYISFGKIFLPRNNKNIKISSTALGGNQHRVL
jgi:hypothetical protein